MNKVVNLLEAAREMLVDSWEEKGRRKGKKNRG